MTAPSPASLPTEVNARILSPPNPRQQPPHTPWWDLLQLLEWMVDAPFPPRMRLEEAIDSTMVLLELDMEGLGCCRDAARRALRQGSAVASTRRPEGLLVWVPVVDLTASHLSA